MGLSPPSRDETLRRRREAATARVRCSSKHREEFAALKRRNVRDLVQRVMWSAVRRAFVSRPAD